MSVTRDEINAAVTAVERERGILLSRDLAYSLACKVDEKKNRYRFVEAIRFSLNDLRIGDPERRQQYAAVIGKHFGRHGGKVRAARRRAGAPAKPIPIRKTSFKLEPNGQFAFEI